MDTKTTKMLLQKVIDAAKHSVKEKSQNTNFTPTDRIELFEDQTDLLKELDQQTNITLTDEDDEALLNSL